MSGQKVGPVNMGVGVMAQMAMKNPTMEDKPTYTLLANIFL